MRDAVDLAGVQSRQQVAWGQIDELDVLGLVENPVGYGFALAYARDARHDVVQAFQVLNIERGPDVDAGGQNLLDVLPPLRMALFGKPIRDIRVGQLVDDQYGGVARQCRVEIELAARDASIFHLERRQLFETVHQAFRFEPAVRLHVSDDQIDAGGACGACGLEHGIGFADARDGAEEDFQTPAPLRCFMVLERCEQFIRIEALVPGHQCSESSARLSSRTLTIGSPRMPRNGPVSCCLMSDWMAATGRWRSRATRAAW